MTYLIVWLLVAATLAHPFGKHVPHDGSNRPTRIAVGCILALLWPYELFMLLRLQFLRASVGVMGNVG